MCVSGLLNLELHDKHIDIREKKRDGKKREDQKIILFCFAVFFLNKK